MSYSSIIRKKCKCCGIDKPLSEFYPKINHGKPYIGTKCKKCERCYINKYNSDKTNIPTDLEGETWVSILNNRYQFSNFGRLKSIIRPSVLFKQVLRKGYVTYNLTLESKVVKLFSQHRLLAELFIPNPLNLPMINHKNGIRNDNRLENLEWCTQNENMQHAIDTGLFKNGCGNRKLNDEQVKYVFNSNLTTIYLAKELNVDYSVIYRIKKGRSWAKLNKKQL